MKARNIPQHRLVLLDGHLAPTAPSPSIESLIEERGSHPPYVEHTFKPGEAKTAIAFLCFSSGTTGNPKVSPCPRCMLSCFYEAQDLTECY